LLKSKIIDPFHGGRCLEAIYTLKNLTGIETSLLIYLGSKLNFKDFHHSKVTASVSHISNAIKFKSSAIKSAIKSLSNKSYLIIENNFDHNGSKIENTYSISDYLFQCYVELKACHVDDSRETTMVSRETTMHSRETTSYIPSSLPDSNPEIQILETNNFNDNEKICVVSGGEAYVPPKLTHSDTKQRLEYQTLSHENLNSSVQGDFDIEEIEFEKPMKTVNEQFNSRIVKAAQEVLNNKTPRVTPSHRKMVAVFRPKASLKSFVQDNDIHFMTDQVLEKYGDYGHVIIEYLYQNQIKYKKLGELAWNPNEVWRLIDTSKKLLDEEKENTHE
jgi:hypothetical protein